MELEKAYNPKETESRIYQHWLKSGYFNPDKLPGRRKKTYTIMIAPPNITGSLHMGHALENTISDILVRFHRMQGFKTLWLPGTDHAGIATQNVVEKELKKQGLTRHDLGKEEFLKEIWQWRDKYGNIILDQLKKLGCSLDWSRTRFTMDEDYQTAVKTAFKHYYKKGLIYQGERVINWCVKDQTALSDLELEYTEEKSRLWYIRYPIKDDSDFIIVATTRPETMLGDAAVAVNSKDKRYKKLVGKTVLLPIIHREIPIIADLSVDMKFGTGAVKVTPAHDLADSEIAERNRLPYFKVIDEVGRIVNVSEEFDGSKIHEARHLVVEKLRALNLLEKEEEFSHNVAKCYRCNTTIEPLLSKQWFLKMKPLAKKTLKAMGKGEVHYHPVRWKRIALEWLENVRDWCISRQIWWGHSIPILYCGGWDKAGKPKMGFHESVVSQVLKGKTKTYRLRDHSLKIGDKIAFENSQTKILFGFGVITNIEKTVVGKIQLDDPAHGATYQKVGQLITAFKHHYPDKKINTKSEVWIYTFKFETFSPQDKREGCGQVITASQNLKLCPACGGNNLTLSPETFDTWFSSALWPFATLGWPKQAKDLKEHYPTSLITSDRGILHLWITRMIFSGLEFMGQVPFKDALIHATILTKDGKRMSKSLGTGVDPLDLIEKYGADAIRFGLIFQAFGGQDIRFNENVCLMGKKFANKLWNIARFVLTNLPPHPSSPSRGEEKGGGGPKAITDADRKILTMLNKTIKEVTKNTQAYHFGEAAHIIYDFVWHDLADKYLETSKAQLKDKKLKNNTLITLSYLLITTLKLLHPFMPFVTEEIWAKLNPKDLLMVAAWPK